MPRSWHNPKRAVQLVLNIIDDYNRQALIVEGDYSFPSEAVIRQMQRAIHEYGKPQSIRVNIGPKLTCSNFQDWCNKMDIRIQFIQPGKPMQNGYIEKFNRTFRQDVMDASMFKDLYEFNNIKDEWREDYNHHRPHESLNNHSPIKYGTA